MYSCILDYLTVQYFFFLPSNFSGNTLQPPPSSSFCLTHCIHMAPMGVAGPPMNPTVFICGINS